MHESTIKDSLASREKIVDQSDVIQNDLCPWQKNGKKKIRMESRKNFTNCYFSK